MDNNDIHRSSGCSPADPEANLYMYLPLKIHLDPFIGVDMLNLAMIKPSARLAVAKRLLVTRGDQGGSL